MPDIPTYFGLHVSIENAIDSRTFDHMRGIIEEQLTNQHLTVPPDAEIYIKNVHMEFKQKHFGIEGLVHRISHISVKVEVPTRMKRIGTMRLIDLKCDPDPDVKVNRYHDNLHYKLSGAYIESHDSYSDYVAIIVGKEFAFQRKNLNVKFTAHATPEFAKHLKNNKEGTASKHVNFELTREVQLLLLT